MGKRFSKFFGRKESTTKFTFENLPLVCQLKIFTFLSAKEKAVAAQVCVQWNRLTKSPKLWSDVDFTEFTLCSGGGGEHHCTEQCYKAYQRRVMLYHQFLMDVKPFVRRFSFAFDIGDYRDCWLELMQSFLQASRCADLTTASLNWKQTPMKPVRPDNITWCTNDYNEVIHRHRHRQRLFVKFFDLFTASCPGVEKLVMPFDWSERSIQALCRLQNIRSLVLEKYFVYQTLDQTSLDQLIQTLPRLTHLTLEVWTPSGSGLLFYSVASASLEYLDISKCRGFYLGNVDVPKLKTLKASRHPWNGPLVTADSLRVPCIHHVLGYGATHLEHLNDHKMESDWQKSVSESLNSLLKSICSCSMHRSDWDI